MAVISHNTPLPTPAVKVKKAIVRKLTGAAGEIYETLPLCGIGDSFLVDGNLKGIRLTAGKIASRLTKEAAARGESAGFGTLAAEQGSQICVWRVTYKPKVAKVKAAV